MDLSTNSEFDDLRRKAEEILKKKHFEMNEEPTHEELLRLVYNFEVYQIELELQNEELKLARERAETIAYKYTSLYDFAPIGYFTLSKDGKIQDLNLFGAKLMGRVRSSLKGRFFGQFFSSKDLSSFNEFLEKVFISSNKVVSELTITGPEGNSLMVQMTGIVEEEHGENCLLTVLDITDRKKAEIELEETATQMKALNSQKDMFFSIIAHDLKGPFNAIVGYSELLVMELKEKEYQAVEEYAGIILDSSNKAMDLLRNLMLWAQSQTGRLVFTPTKISLLEVVNEVTDMFDQIARQKDITIKKEISAEIEILADKNMIASVVRNLVSNAVKFTLSGGEITIFTKETPQSYTLCVRDFGIGIPELVLEKLFTFDGKHTTLGTKNEKGSGLGLILCKDFMDKHNGRIWAETGKDVGSTFYVEFPRRS